MTMRVLCCGGRDFNNGDFVVRAFTQLKERIGSFAVIHGDANGADRLSGSVARIMGLPVIIVPAQWDKYGKSAGSMRNQWMLELCLPEYAIAFPGGVGTADMVRRLTKANVTTWDLRHGAA